MNSIHILKVRFSLPLHPARLPQFRGAVAESAGWDKSDLFHNHATRQMEPVMAGVEPEAKSITTLKDSYIYRYPLIHYRVEKGKAAIYAINEGAAAVRQWLLGLTGNFMINGREVPLLISGMQEEKLPLKMLTEMKTYRLMDYIPFHADNYQKWLENEDMISRVKLLETVLTGHILGFATAMDWRLEKRLELSLTAIREMRTVKLHNHNVLGFNLLYKANIQLPGDSSLGRGISLGYGVQRQTRT